MSLLAAMALCTILLAQPAATPAALTASVSADHSLHVADAAMGECVVIAAPKGLTLSAAHDKTALVLSAHHPALQEPVHLIATIKWGPEPYPCRLAPNGNDDGVMQIEYGGEPTGLCDAVFDRFHDRALQIKPAGLSLVGKGPTYSLGLTIPAGKAGAAEILRLKVVPNFYRDVRGIKYYAPIDRSVFKHPLAGWCTWYYYYRGISEDEVVKNVHWLSANLRKFGLHWIQIDDGWQAKGTAKSGVWRDWRGFDPDFPHGMKWLADQIKAGGFQAGVWLTPFGTNAEDIVKAHPDWFVQDKPGHYYDSGWIGHYLIDPTNPPVRDQYLTGLFSRMANDWGYDYFKIDGQPPTVGMYRKLRDHLHKPMDGTAAYRLGLKAIRDAIGPKRFLLGCWGTPLEGIGLMNGSRTGGDVGSGWGRMMPAYDATRSWYFLNNVAWYCDPDCLCIRDPMTHDQALVWASLYGLTGEHFMLSDKMYDLPADRVEIIKRLLPVADVRPADLYARNRIDTIHLSLPGPGGPSSVIALFNWGRRAVRRTVDLAKLGLPASGRERYLLYDFWRRGCLGETTGTFKITLAPTSCLVLDVRQWDRRPTLAGLDRHIAQSAVGLSALQVSDSGSSRTIRGTSEIVAGETYRMAFALPYGWHVQSQKASGQDAAVSTESAKTPGIAFVDLKGPRSGEVRWSVEFKPQPRIAPPMSRISVTGLKLTGLKITPRRGNMHLTWDATPGACYYKVDADGAEIARTATTEAWDRPGAKTPTYRVLACDLLGHTLGRSEDVKPVLPKPVTPPKPEVYLSDLKPVSAKQGWGQLHMNQSVEGHPLTIHGRKFAHGLGTHAASEIVYDLGGKSGKLVGWCGVDDEAHPGTVGFHVYVNGKQLWESDILESGDAPVGFVIPFVNAHELKLVVDDGGDGINFDHADWADVGLIWNK